jgi:photosystem II stability/assembly factor-like uncharacterized protein
MKLYRLIGVALAAAIVFTGRPLVGRSEQSAATPPEGQPFDTLHFRPIGPASMSGRITDLAVYETNPALYYVATAHGGVWKTSNNGTTFEAIFQDQGPLSIGDVTISQSNPDLLWVGSGESSNRQSVSWGDGVYKSTDGGKTFTHMGLGAAKAINRIVIDPRENNIVFVAVTGSLWGPGSERGIYKTVDGGKTWKQTLKVDDDTGANEVAMDPSNSQILYATMYQRRRTQCCFNGGGPGSGIFKSTDGGETWTKLKGGVLDSELGRIAIDVYRKRPNIIYALIEGPTQATGGRGGRGAGPPGEEGPGGTPAVPQEAPGGGRGAASGAVNTSPTGMYRSDDAGATWRKVNNANPRPMYFSQIDIDPTDDEVVYLGGVGLHQTLDGGKTIATDVAEPIHDDVHAIWINPTNPLHVLIGNDGGLAVSYDRAKTWAFLPNLPVGLFYHVSYDMAIPFNVCGGMQDNYNWCGPSEVRGTVGIPNHAWSTLQGGDGFHVLQDPTDYRVAFSESQDGNIVRVDRVTGETMSVRPLPGPGEPALRWHWDTPILLSPHDPKVVYAAANKVFRSPDRGLSWAAISADLTTGQDRDTLETMGVKGSDIKFSRHDGIQAWPAIVSLAESPKRAGLLYAGTDDGSLAVTRDGGKTWTQIVDRVPGVPKGTFVSEVVPSRFDEGTVYVTFDGHRLDDFETWIFVSNDFGQTFRAVSSNLKGEVARTLTEDVRNPDVLYLGTDTGLFLTLDRGKSWQRLKANLPNVRIDEITLHPRDNSMILATHGRALWILDHLEPIQEFAAAQTVTADAKLFTPPTYAMYRRPVRDKNYEFWGNQTFLGENPPQAAVISWFQKKPVTTVQLKITDAGGREIREISGTALASVNRAGIQSACWDLRVQPLPAVGAAGRGQGGAQAAAQAGGQAGGQAGVQGGRQGGPAGTQAQSPFGAGCGGAGAAGGRGGFGAAAGNPGPFVLAGTYNVSLVVDGKTLESRPLKVMADPEVILTEAERKKLFDMAMELHELQRRANEVAAGIGPLNTRLSELSKEAASKSDLPADLKASVDTLQKDVAELAPKLAMRLFGGRGGGRGGGAADSLVARLAQAKTVLMGGMWPNEASMRAYTDSKAQLPKAIADANVLFTRAATLGSALSRHSLTLTAPTPIK